MHRYLDKNIPVQAVNTWHGRMLPPGAPLTAKEREDRDKIMATFEQEKKPGAKRRPKHLIW